MMSAVGASFIASVIQLVSDTYCTGTKSRAAMPSSRCAASSLRSNVSTLPIAK